MTTPSISDLSALREVAEKATPGPWTWGQKYVAKATGTGCYHSVAMAPSGDTEPEGSQWEHDAAYIAAANPQTVLALLALLASEKARADAAEAERVRLWNECRDLKGSLDAADAACSSIKRERDAAIHGGKDNPMVGTHPYYAAGISTAEIIAEAREFLEEELAQYMFPEYDADCEIDCQRSHGYIGALIERLSIAEATIATLTAERDALKRERDEARKALENFNPHRIGAGFSIDLAALETAWLIARGVLDRSALSDANAAEREGNGPFVFASRHNDATGECDPVEISPEKARRIYEKMATRRTPETKP